VGIFWPEQLAMAKAPSATVPLLPRNSGNILTTTYYLVHWASQGYQMGINSHFNSVIFKTIAF